MKYLDSVFEDTTEADSARDLLRTAEGGGERRASIANVKRDMAFRLSKVLVKKKKKKRKKGKKNIIICSSSTISSPSTFSSPG